MLVNKTNKQAVIEKVRFARTALQRARGMMLRKKSDFDYALVFELPCASRIGASIHMLFVFFPIDAVFLDSEKRVVDVACNLKPFALNHTPKKSAKYIVELPEGKASGTAIGDALEW